MVPGDTGFQLDASTFSGDIRSDLTLTATSEGRGAMEGAAHRPGPATHSLKGTYRDGSAMLELRTFNGDVIITKR